MALDTYSHPTMQCDAADKLDLHFSSSRSKTVKAGSTRRAVGARGWVNVRQRREPRGGPRQFAERVLTMPTPPTPEQAIADYQKSVRDQIAGSPVDDAMTAYERYASYLPPAAVPVLTIRYATGGNADTREQR